MKMFIILIPLFLYCSCGDAKDINNADEDNVENSSGNNAQQGNDFWLQGQYSVIEMSVLESPNAHLLSYVNPSYLDSLELKVVGNGNQANLVFGNRTGRHVLWFENINIEENGYFSKEFTALDVLNPVDWVFFDCGNEVSVLDITSQQDTISISGTRDQGEIQFTVEWQMYPEFENLTLSTGCLEALETDVGNGRTLFTATAINENYDPTATSVQDVSWESGNHTIIRSYSDSDGDGRPDNGTILTDWFQSVSVLNNGSVSDITFTSASGEVETFEDCGIDIFGRFSHIESRTVNVSNGEPFGYLCTIKRPVGCTNECDVDYNIRGLYLDGKFDSLTWYDRSGGYNDLSISIDLE